MVILVEVAVRRRRFGSAGFLLGLASLALLAASIRYAHHWSPSSLALVGGWGMLALAAPVLSAIGRRDGGWSGRLAGFGLTHASLNAVTLVIAGGGLRSRR